MIIITYCKEGKPISDFECEDFLNEVKLTIQYLAIQDSFFFDVSTSGPIYIVKKAIAENEIDYKKIQFVFNHQVLEPNYYGAIINHPKGFADFECQCSESILRAAMKKREKEKIANGSFQR
jgi:hypothetical protein